MNDALAVVIFTIVKIVVDEQYGCTSLTEQTCLGAHGCLWDNDLKHCKEQEGGSSDQDRLDVWGIMAKDVFGGAILGASFAWLFSLMMKRIRMPNINLLLSITMVLDIIALSNRLEGSPAVACAAAGLVFRSYGFAKLERRTQLELDIMWSFFAEALNGMFFLLIGLYSDYESVHYIGLFCCGHCHSCVPGGKMDLGVDTDPAVEQGNEPTVEESLAASSSVRHPDYDVEGGGGSDAETSSSTSSSHLRRSSMILAMAQHHSIRASCTL